MTHIKVNFYSSLTSTPNFAKRGGKKKKKKKVKETKYMYWKKNIYFKSSSVIGLPISSKRLSFFYKNIFNEIV